MKTFTDCLAVTLSLDISGTTYDIPAGNIKSLELKLQTYGYRGAVSFVVSSELADDTLFTPFTQNDLMTVNLSVQVYDKVATDTLTPLNLTGYATIRTFSEQTLANILKSQDQMLYRVYQLQFADPAQVFWKQHYPCDLRVNATLQSLIAAHTPSQISLTVDDWDALTTQYPFLSLSLGAVGNRANFYDFLIWLVDTQNGVFSYDCNANQYSLSGAKNQNGQIQHLDPTAVNAFSVDFPEICRYQPNVLNAYSENPQISAISNSVAAPPIRRDYIARYPIAADMQARVTLETDRMKQPLYRVNVDYKSFQIQVTPPGQFVDFKGSSAWNAALFVQESTYRVREWRLSAVALDLQDSLADINNDHAHYSVELGIRLENSTELCVDLPDYTEPLYPFYVEGKIVSDKGSETDATYQFYTNQNTSVNYYEIKIPLWNNQIVNAAYQPNLATGQFYFPPYKNARVLVGLGLNTAEIAYFLDWEAGSALPLDSQGNQIVMGTSTTNRNSIKHTYVDSKPELQIQRTLNQDTELLQFSDGYILIQTQTEQDQGGG